MTFTRTSSKLTKSGLCILLIFVKTWILSANKWKATLKQHYFPTPWAVLSIIAAALSLILTSIQAWVFCYFSLGSLDLEFILMIVMVHSLRRIRELDVFKYHFHVQDTNGQWVFTNDIQICFTQNLNTGSQLLKLAEIHLTAILSKPLIWKLLKEVAAPISWPGLDYIVAQYHDTMVSTNTTTTFQTIFDSFLTFRRCDLSV